jgi:hypothetical protein
VSIPRDHHYLPQFYLERWARDGTVVRYVRPRGANGPLDCKRKPPKAVAYERDLYQQPDIQDLAASQALELKFFQQIDDRAAIALRKLEEGERGTGEDRVALSRFMVSLLHRSPSRLTAMRKELAQRTTGAPYDGLEGDEFDRVLKATTNRLLAELVHSPEAARLVSQFRAFKVDVSASSKTLLTSDRPVMLSAQLVASDAFMIMPYAPDRLLILTHKEPIAGSFSSQDPTVLVNGMNQAIVEQSEDIVVASDERDRPMVDRLFLRPGPNVVFDAIGLIRRKSPLVDLSPRVRKFSRHDKRAMKYLGR